MMTEATTQTNEANHKILAIEDDPDVLALYKSYLQKRGYQVLSATGATEGISLLQSNPDTRLILLDLNLPGGMSGEEWIAWYIAQGQKTPVTVLKLGNQRALEIGLDKVNLPPGDYRLNGFWDWAPFQASGGIHVRPLSDFKEAKLMASSQDRLLAHSGKMPVTLSGNDFEFTDKVKTLQARLRV